MSELLRIVEKYSQISKKKDFWEGSPFKSLLQLGSDERGKLGEEYIYNLTKKEFGWDSEWEGDKNTSRRDGSIWDNLIKNKRTEIKLAMRGTTTPTWQHEKITEENIWDKVIFVDIDYNGVWFTVQNYGDIPYNDEKHSILNTKSTWHLGGWKFDLSLHRLEKLKNEGYSYFMDLENPNPDELKSFFESHFRND